MSEQGLGDTLQFVRYALALQNQGVDVTVLSQSPLLELLRNSVGLRKVVDCIDIEEEQQRNPVWLPLMNLAPMMGCIKKQIPFPDGYVQASAESIAKWRERLDRKPNHRLIALHWQGNPDHEHSLYSRGRSLPFREWLGLQGNDQLEFVARVVLTLLRWRLSHVVFQRCCLLIQAILI